MKRRPTMRDVARLAGGLHPSTVSLALRNSPAISKETTRRVQNAARKIGYRPDPLLDAYNFHRKEVLPHKTLPVVAFLCDLSSRDAVQESRIHKAYLEGCQKAAETLHCKLDYFYLAPGQLGAERLHAILLTRAISGVIVAGFTTDPFGGVFPWREYSAVKIESPHLACPSYTVAVDRRNAARLAWQKLREQGGRRIGLALSSGAQPWHRDLYEAGVLLQQAKTEGAPEIPVLKLDRDDEPRAVCHDWIRRQAIDAVICDRPELVSEILRARSAGDPAVSFACLDATEAPAEIQGALPDHVQAGEHAMTQTVGLLRANDRGPSETPSLTYIPVSWRDPLPATVALPA